MVSIREFLAQNYYNQICTFKLFEHNYDKINLSTVLNNLNKTVAKLRKLLAREPLVLFQKAQTAKFLDVMRYRK